LRPLPFLALRLSFSSPLLRLAPAARVRGRSSHHRIVSPARRAGRDVLQADLSLRCLQRASFYSSSKMASSPRHIRAAAGPVDHQVLSASCGVDGCVASFRPAAPHHDGSWEQPRTLHCQPQGLNPRRRHRIRADPLLTTKRRGEPVERHEMWRNWLRAATPAPKTPSTQPWSWTGSALEPQISSHVRPTTPQNINHCVVKLKGCCCHSAPQALERSVPAEGKRDASLSGFLCFLLCILLSSTEVCLFFLLS
ncbi:unnamed protein product, partial [Urochloa humidicola]